MDRLILLRHGDAERDADSGDDFDRALSRVGHEESAGAGQALAELGLIPDLALVSGAVRTRETWTELAPSFPSARARFEDTLYLADTEIITAALGQAAPTTKTLMVVAHNPGLQDLALRLLIQGGAPPSAIQRVRTAFPTGGAAVFLFDGAGRPAYDGLFYPRDRR